ncbi:hypothetical protein [Sphingomonas sp.]|uniref:hypothetical protein n=1 Tax=Sphingomonas sp. TaxID=28214 RepID=UPI001B211999|nr:hypothetical protein [Sphingomonas sp.]MBO9712522.1 hypothetical protein [Sphingomonas sp.]
MILSYDWAGGREAMLRFGPLDGPVVVALPPLFEEANRMRATLVAMLRALARQGIASLLPDLPGTGESTVPLADVTLATWREAFAGVLAAAGRPAHGLSVRGGALVEAGADLRSRWQLTPVDGQDLVRDLFRMRAIADPNTPRDFDPLAPSPEGPPVELAGNRMPRPLLCELIGATPQVGGATRVARLGKDRRIADLALPDTPPWRRAEPGQDLPLAETLAADLAAWIRSCGG